MHGTALSMLNQRMHDPLLEGRSPRSFLTYHKTYEITIISILQCTMWDSYIYLKVVVSDEKVPEDSCLVEIAQTNHVFNSLIVNMVVVTVMVVVVMSEMTMIMMILIIMIVMPTLMTDVVCCACCVV